MRTVGTGFWKFGCKPPGSLFEGVELIVREAIPTLGVRRLASSDAVAICTCSPGFGSARFGRSCLQPYVDAPRRSRVNHESDTTPQARPNDARKATEEQRDLREKLEHLDDDPDAPGLHQSRHNLPDESTR